MTDDVDVDVDDSEDQKPTSEERRFAQYDLANPEMWRMFEQFTFELINNGRTRHGVNGVLHRIRWETTVAARDGTPFKVNNNWAPYYARKFHAMYPQYEGFFSMRRSRADEEDFDALVETQEAEATEEQPAPANKESAP